MKILVYNKMKRENKSYAEACKEVEKLVNQVNKSKEQKKEEKKSFKDEFAKLRDG